MYYHKPIRIRVDMSTETPKKRKALKYNNHKYRLLLSGEISFIIERERKI